MTWYFDPTDDWGSIDIYDHNGDLVLTVDNPNAPTRRRDPQGVPVSPDVRAEVLEYLKDRGQADLYALLGIAEALTGAGFEEGTP